MPFLSLENIMKSHKDQMNKTPLYGLVLSGGKSTRMKKDKSTLEYYGKTQTQFCYELLSRYCTQVFISNRKEQKDLGGHKGLPQIHDTFINK